jgi:hypothetical protein
MWMLCIVLAHLIGMASAHESPRLEIKNLAYNRPTELIGIASFKGKQT